MTNIEVDGRVVVPAAAQRQASVLHLETENTTGSRVNSNGGIGTPKTRGEFHNNVALNFLSLRRVRCLMQVLAANRECSMCVYSDEIYASLHGTHGN